MHREYCVIWKSIEEHIYNSYYSNSWRRVQIFCLTMSVGALYPCTSSGRALLPLLYLLIIPRTCFEGIYEKIYICKKTIIINSTVLIPWLIITTLFSYFKAGSLSSDKSLYNAATRDPCQTFPFPDHVYFDETSVAGRFY